GDRVLGLESVDITSLERVQTGLGRGGSVLEGGLVGGYSGRHSSGSIVVQLLGLGAGLVALGLGGLNLVLQTDNGVVRRCLLNHYPSPSSEEPRDTRPPSSRRGWSSGET